MPTFHHRRTFVSGNASREATVERQKRQGMYGQASESHGSQPNNNNNKGKKRRIQTKI